MKRYEGMFILDNAKCQEDLDGALGELKALLERHGVTVLDIAKWEERRLAYEVNKKNRGVYVLTHFEAPADAIAQIHRTCGLSELVLRALILVQERPADAIFLEGSDDDGKPEQGSSDRKSD